jgi:hypothetical protein
MGMIGGNMARESKETSGSHPTPLNVNTKNARLLYKTWVEEVGNSEHPVFKPLSWDDMSRESRQKWLNIVEKFVKEAK